jgi:hypothetical protein
MNKVIKQLSFLIFAFCSVIVFAENGARVFENDGKFSYCPPLNWNVTEFPGLKYKVVMGPTDGNYTANITFVDETADVSLQDYVKTNLDMISTYFQGYKLVKRSSFKTNSGISGEFIVVNSVQSNLLLRQIIYFLPAPNNRYFRIVCSVLDEFSSKYLQLFEDSVKTFELAK